MPDATQLQFLGHASFRFTLPDGRVLLLDPWLSDNPFVPEALRQPERADVVLVTHGHGDHLDHQLPALLARTGATLLAPPAVRFYLQSQGVPAAQCEALNVGGTVTVHGVPITMAPAVHPAHIDLPDGTPNAHPHAAVGYVLHLPGGPTVYAAGNTAVFGDMRLLADLYRPTLALLPIGDRYTMGPRESAHATRLLRTPHVVPFHYDTYPTLTGTPAQLQAHLAAEDNVTVHEH